MEKNHPPVTRTPVDKPKRDFDQSHTPWSPGEGEQGISNRPDDETDAMPDGDDSSDAGAFNPGSKRNED